MICTVAKSPTGGVFECVKPDDINEDLIKNYEDRNNETC